MVDEDRSNGPLIGREAFPPPRTGEGGLVRAGVPGRETLWLIRFVKGLLD